LSQKSTRNLIIVQHQQSISQLMFDMHVARETIDKDDGGYKFGLLAVRPFSFMKITAEKENITKN
jgi:hypothetical protein